MDRASEGEGVFSSLQPYFLSPNPKKQPVSGDLVAGISPPRSVVEAIGHSPTISNDKVKQTTSTTMPSVVWLLATTANSSKEQRWPVYLAGGGVVHGVFERDVQMSEALRVERAQCIDELANDEHDLRTKRADGNQMKRGRVPDERTHQRHASRADATVVAQQHDDNSTTTTTRRRRRRRRRSSKVSRKNQRAQTETASWTPAHHRRTPRGERGNIQRHAGSDSNTQAAIATRTHPLLRNARVVLSGKVEER